MIFFSNLPVNGEEYHRSLSVSQYNYRVTLPPIGLLTSFNDYIFAPPISGRNFLSLEADGAEVEAAWVRSLCTNGDLLSLQAQDASSTFNLDNNVTPSETLCHLTMLVLTSMEDGIHRGLIRFLNTIIELVQLHSIANLI